MMWFTKQERFVLISVAAVLTVGVSLNYLFQVNPQLKKFVKIIESDQIYRKFDVNQASSEDLQRIPGIGPVTANRIIDYRLQHQGFRDLSELRSIRGIGPSTYQSIIKYFKPIP